MATKIGSLVAGIGAKMAATFPTYSVVYGLPDGTGTYGPNGGEVYVHFAQESSEFSGNQLGGVSIISPTISVSVWRSLSASSTLLATQQSLIDLAADLRVAILAMVLAHVDGSATISGLSGSSLWVTDYTMTTAQIDIGAGQSTESVTAEFTFKLSSTYGSR